MSLKDMTSATTALSTAERRNRRSLLLLAGILWIMTFLNKKQFKKNSPHEKVKFFTDIPEGEATCAHDEHGSHVTVVVYLSFIVIVVVLVASAVSQREPFSGKTALARVVFAHLGGPHERSQVSLIQGLEQAVLSCFTKNGHKASRSSGHLTIIFGIFD